MSFGHLVLSEGRSRDVVDLKVVVELELFDKLIEKALNVSQSRQKASKIDDRMIE